MGSGRTLHLATGARKGTKEEAWRLDFFDACQIGLRLNFASGVAVRAVLYAGLFLFCAYASAQAEFRVSDFGSGRNCYQVNSRGRAAGPPVEDANCASGKFATADLGHGRMCYNADEHGLPFGFLAPDEACGSGRFGTAKMSGGARLCYNLDDRGRAYGFYVPDEACASENFVVADDGVGPFCYHTEKLSGSAFGFALPDFQCASGRHAVADLGTGAGRLCYNLNAQGRAYGVPLSPQLCGEQSVIGSR
jgi:hypothetical protein